MKVTDYTHLKVKANRFGVAIMQFEKEQRLSGGYLISISEQEDVVTAVAGQPVTQTVVAEMIA